jgi:hypothetical protein
MVSLNGHHAYLDANTVIYALQGFLQYANLKNGLLVPLDAGELTAVTSQLTLLEAIVFPRRNGDEAGEKVFRPFLNSAANVTVEPTSPAV